MRPRTFSTAVTLLPAMLAASAAYGDDKEDARFRAGAKKGLASLCIGGGMGVALAVER